MRKATPLSELLKNEGKTIMQQITKEQVYDKLVTLAFDRIYDMIELSAKKGNHLHVIGGPQPLDSFNISSDFYNAMAEKRCDLYYTTTDDVYCLFPPALFEEIRKNGFVGSKSTIMYTHGGQKLVTDLQKRFKTEGIALQFVPYIMHGTMKQQLPIGVPFKTPAGYGVNGLNVEYEIHYNAI